MHDKICLKRGYVSVKLIISMESVKKEAKNSIKGW
jgi:hypothetical protein